MAASEDPVEACNMEQILMYNLLVLMFLLSEVTRYRNCLSDHVKDKKFGQRITPKVTFSVGFGWT